MDKNIYTLRINWIPSYYQEWTFKIVVPKDITIEKANKIIMETYLKLKEDGYYGDYDISPVELLDYICEEYGWDEWMDFEFDIDLELKR